MKIKIKSRDFNKTVTIRGNTVNDALNQIKLIRENYVITKSGKIILSDEKLKNNDELILYPVISGG